MRLAVSTTFAMLRIVGNGLSAPPVVKGLGGSSSKIESFLAKERRNKYNELDLFQLGPNARKDSPPASKPMLSSTPSPPIVLIIFIVIITNEPTNPHHNEVHYHRPSRSSRLRQRQSAPLQSPSLGGKQQ